MTIKKKKFDMVTFGFIAPAFLLFTLFIIVPTLASVYYSFTSWDGLSPTVKFVGLANYREIATGARFRNALVNTFLLFSECILHPRPDQRYCFRLYLEDYV